MTDFLEGLNREQLAAVTLPAQSALILAGAGSGKTRVLTTRIAWLIQTGQIGPHGVLAVTFTNKAAREMLARIGTMLPLNLRGMWVGTFHGLCNRLLRAHYRDAGLVESFQIMDSGEQLSLLKRVQKSLNIDEDRYPARQTQYFVNANKEEGLRPKDVEAHDELGLRMLAVYEAYEVACRREGVVDFAELLLRTVELLEANEILRDHYRNRFRHILVDEFQDTNRLQYRWLKLLAGSQNVVFAVGDDDQSIYAFRGAQARHMLDFERDFKVENLIRLEQNYRSHGNILAAANALIAHNTERLGKELWTDAGKGEPLRYFEGRNDGEEAGFIVEEVLSLRREDVTLNEIAVLYRSNAQSRVIEHALFTAGLPYRVYGGLRFFERQEVKHALAYLRLIANPDDDGAWLRVVNMPPRGIGARTVEQIQVAAQQTGHSLWQAACSSPPGGRTGAALGGFVRLIEEMRSRLNTLNLPELIEHLLDGSGLRTHYQAERDGADRLENLDELVNAAAAFLHEAEEPSLTSFLAHASLESGEHQAQASDNALQLMTVHSAKGLEFHTVFVSGLEDGLFPHEQSLYQDQGLEEERRLMYVAITRARRRLYLTCAQTRMLHGQTRYSQPSRFLHELPADLVRPLNSGPVGKVKTQSTGGYRLGQSVRHDKFGLGVIVKIIGQGPDAEVEINFGANGLKRLMLEYARLTIG